MSLESLKNKRVIIVGDSHTDLYPFGERLVAGLRDAGADVTVLAVGGTAASSWLGKKQPLCRKAVMGKPAKCQSLKEVKGKTFDLAIIALGTNDAANMNRAAAEGGGARAGLMRQVVGQLDRLGSSLAPRYIWIGPPPVTGKLKWYTQDAMDALYAAAAPVLKGRMIDSRELVPAGYKSDGAHLLGSSATGWADGVLDRLDGVVVTSASPGAETAAPLTYGDGRPVSALPLIVLGVVAAAALVVFFKRRGAAGLPSPAAA
jgi:hypothetical protein